MHNKPVQRDPIETVSWSAGEFGTLLLSFTCVWFEQRKIWSQFIPILFATHFCQRRRHWNYCHQEKEPISLVQIWCDLAIANQENFWRSKLSWFILEGIQNFTNQKILPLRTVWSPWQNAGYRTSTYDAFHSKLPNCKPLETEHTDLVYLLKSELTTEQAVIKQKLSKPPLLGLRYNNTCNNFGGKSKWALSETFWVGATKKMLYRIWKQLKKLLSSTTTEISICYCLVRLFQTWPTFVYTNLLMKKSITSPKHIEFFRKNSRRCFWQSIYRFYTKKNCWWNFYSKINKSMQFFVGIDASQLYPYSMCQPMLTPLDIDSKMGRFTLRQNETRSLEITVLSYFQRKRPISKFESFYTTGIQRKLAASVLMGFVLIATLCSRQLLAFTFLSLSRKTSIFNWKR